MHYYSTTLPIASYHNCCNTGHFTNDSREKKKNNPERDARRKGINMAATKTTEQVEHSLLPCTACFDENCYHMHLSDKQRLG